MTISKQFVSRLIAAILVISSLSLSAMDWDGEFRPHTQMGATGEQAQVAGLEAAQDLATVGQEPAVEKPVLMLKEDGSAPDGYIFYDSLIARKSNLLKEKMRLTQLAIKAIKGIPGMKLRVLLFNRDLAIDARMGDDMQRLADIPGGNVSKKVITQEIAAPILQEMDTFEHETLLKLSSSVRGLAKAAGRFDVIAELEKREMTQEDINAMRWHKVKKVLEIAVPLGAVTAGIAAVIWVNR